MATDNQTPDVDFLQAFLETQRNQYESRQQLCSSDLTPVDGLPTTSDDEERCAKIADLHGFDGNLFRNLFVVEEFDALLGQLRKRIRTIPQIIAAIEKQREVKPTDDQRAILQLLDKQEDPMLQKAIIAVLPMSERKVRDLMDDLAARGYLGLGDPDKSRSRGVRSAYRNIIQTGLRHGGLGFRLASLLADQ